MASFKIGDRVRCTVDGAGDVIKGPSAGMIGTVLKKKINPFISLSYGVGFDEWFDNAHNIGSDDLLVNGWWCSEQSLELFDDVMASECLDPDEVLL